MLMISYYVLPTLFLLFPLMVIAQNPASTLTLFIPETTAANTVSASLAFIPIGTGTSDTTYEAILKAPMRSTTITETQTFIVSESGFSNVQAAATLGVRLRVNNVCTIDGKGGAGCVRVVVGADRTATTTLTTTITGKAAGIITGAVFPSRGALNDNGALAPGVNHHSSIAFAAVSVVVVGITLGAFAVV